MKILKKPKFKKCTCRVCECVFMPSSSDILADADGPWKEGRLFARCPVCLAACETAPRTHRLAPVVTAPVVTVPVDKKEEAHECYNCKYTDKGFDEEPCGSCDCDERDKWVKMEDRHARN